MSETLNTPPMAQPRMSQDTIRGLATEKSFLRGRDYFHEGAVSGLVLRGDLLTAEVKGTGFKPYHVSIRFSGSGIAGAHCTCPYDRSGCCKHVVAVLLTISEQREAVVERKPMRARLAALDLDRLVDLLEKLSASDAALATWIEAEAATAPPARSPRLADADRRTAVDPAPVRDRADVLPAAHRRSGRYWDGYRSAGDIEHLQRLVHNAVPFLEAGDGANALRILAPICEAFVKQWIDHGADSNEHFGALFADLGRLLAEAVLMSDLTAQAHDVLAEELAGWQSQLAGYGIDTAFDAAVGALAAGWDSPALVAVLAGKRKAWPPAAADAWMEALLIDVRLRVLDACGRTEEYLNLARAARARTSYAGMLVRLGRVPEAMSYALKSFKRPDESLALARMLRDAGAHDDAFKVAEAGLALAGATAARTSYCRC